MKKGRSNGRKAQEHLKPMIEMLSNSRQSIEDYAGLEGLTFSESALLLLFNELRCMHYHMDQLVGIALKNEQEKAEKSGAQKPK